MQVDFDRLVEYETEGKLRHSVDPSGALHVWCYSQATVYNQEWDDITRICRGLVTDIEGNVISLPFPKFFNWGQDQAPGPEITSAPFQAYDKMDGCVHKLTRLNLWSGGTISIGEVVDKRLPVTLIGMQNGNLVPSEVTAWAVGKTTKSWVKVRVSCCVNSSGNVATATMTADHPIWSSGSWVPAGELRPGNFVSHGKPHFGRITTHVVRSGLLGDGSISSGKYSEGHKEEHIEYVQETQRLLGPWGSTRANTVSGYGSKIVWAMTYKSTDADLLREEWYPNGKKDVPLDLDWMDDFSVAKWYMDDGSLLHTDLQRDRAIFATNAFDEQGVKRLAVRLEELFPSLSIVVQQGKGWTLRVNAGQSRRLNEPSVEAIQNFWARITPFIVPCMRYKVPVEYRLLPYTPPIPDESFDWRVEDAEVLFVTSTDGHIAYDISTTTNNFMAQGFLAHNSLIVVGNLDGEAVVSTKGSFNTWHSEAARELLEGFVPYKGSTALFELIHPDNRIVVDYGDRKELVLLGATEMSDRCDHFSPDEYAEASGWHGSTAVQRAFRLQAMLQTVADPANGENREGFVLVWPSADGPSTRVKIKFAQYMQLHHTLSRLSNVAVWEALSTGTFDALLEVVPDEMYDKVHECADDLCQAFAQNKGHAIQVARNAQLLHDERKHQAGYVLGQQHADPSLVFLALDDRDMDAQVWRKIKPARDTTWTFLK